MPNYALMMLLNIDIGAKADWDRYIRCHSFFNIKIDKYLLDVNYTNYIWLVTGIFSSNSSTFSGKVILDPVLGGVLGLVGSSSGIEFR